MNNSPIADKNVYNFRKLDCTEKENICYDVLEKLNIEYRRVSHESIASVDDSAEIRALLGVEVVKNLFLCNARKSEFYLLVMPGEKSLKTKLLSPQLGCSRLSFASPEMMAEHINCVPGSASVLGLIFDKSIEVRLLIDKDLQSYEFIGCHPCDNTSTLSLRVSDIIEKFLPYVHHTPTFVEI